MVLIMSKILHYLMLENYEKDIHDWTSNLQLSDSGVFQAVGTFSFGYFHVFVSIGPIESDLLSLSIPRTNEVLKASGLLDK